MNKKNQSSRNLSRRDFLGKAAIATAAFTIIPRHVMGGKGFIAPSELLNIASIGIGNQGTANIKQLCDPDVAIPDQALPNLKMRVSGGPAPAMTGAAGKQAIRLANVYALCDVDAKYAARTFKGYPKAKVYTDYRELLDKEKEIDAVTIATPDHTHAVIASAAMKLKKHVYLEKPLAKTIHETRFLMNLAKQNNVVTQMGNHGHAMDGTRETVEWIRSGVIGDVKEVYLSTDRPVWDQGNMPRPEAEPIPDTFKWDLFLGPARDKPYSSKIVPFGWRGLWDYGTGALGDMGAHIFDAAIWALDLGFPTKIQASSSPFNDDYQPLAESVTYEFAARNSMPAVKVYWTDGGILPPRPQGLKNGELMPAAVYIGSKGIIAHATHGASPYMIAGNMDFKGVDPYLPRTKTIFEDWIDAVKNGTKACNDFEISGKLTEILLLANIAVKTQYSNTILEYDSANMKMTNLPEANNYFHYEYRKGWSL